MKQLEQKRSGDKSRGQIARPSILRLMLHRGEIDHERSGPKIVNHCFFGLCAYGPTPLFLKLGDGKLPIGLTESYQSDRGGHQIGEIALQEGGQGPRGWNALPRRTNSKNDGEGRLNMAFAEYLRKPVQDAIGPYLAQH